MNYINMQKRLLYVIGLAIIYAVATISHINQSVALLYSSAAVDNYDMDTYLKLVLFKNVTTSATPSQPKGMVEKSGKEQRETILAANNKSTGTSTDVVCERRILKGNNSLTFFRVPDYPSNSRHESETCSSGNSHDWLNSYRFGNARDSLMTAEVIQRMILDLPTILVDDTYANAYKSSHDHSLYTAMKAQSILKTSLCYEQSRFVNDTEQALDEKSIRMWAVRLSYLAIHYHQHRLAIPEAKARYNNGNKRNCPETLSNEYDVGNFDYECGSHAKYLLVPLGGNGLGANVRGMIVGGLVAALAMDRIVIFVNNAPVGDDYMRSTWPLVGCDRKDYQCFFMPTTPCTLTHKDLSDAHVLTDDEARRVYEIFEEPSGHKEDKVIKVNLPNFPLNNVPEKAKKLLSQYAHALIDVIPCDDPRRPAMRRGADLILKDDKPRDGYDYAAASGKIQHALEFYFMRPSIDNAKQIDSILNEIVPKDIDANRAVGLPIRASDKCHWESDCLSFDQHMLVVNSTWSNHQNAIGNGFSDVDVVFTTESKTMAQEQKTFSSNETMQSKYPFSFNFVTNTKDVMPDTGKFRPMMGSSDTLLSAVTSFKAQLLPRVSIGNCCSNFHTMMNDFLSEGCGAAIDNKFLCLNELDDVELRMCCGWHHKCIRDRNRHFQLKNGMASCKQSNKDKQKNLGNSAFCPDCLMCQQQITCQQRMQYVMGKYSITEQEAIESVVNAEPDDCSQSLNTTNT